MAAGNVPEFQIAGTWNKTDGYDSPASVGAVGTNKTILVYLLWSANPRKKTENEFGQTSMKTMPSDRVEGEVWDLHSSSSCARNSDTIVRKMQRMMRVNLKWIVTTTTTATKRNGHKVFEVMHKIIRMTKTLSVS